jgi:NhaA family Na+:H+ antiporter
MSFTKATAPPESSARARKLARLVARPVEKFLHIEAASGVILLVVAVVALIWANSPWAGSYEAFLHAPISVGIGDYAFSKSLHFWVNDILMVVFFFVVGLEVRRELFEGELSTPRRAALPAAAAIGGMLVPASIYLAINAGTSTAGGWGVPMATDIAFAVGVLALLGSRVPPALRILLLALAIIDDIGAILIIALFYSSGIEVLGLATAGAGVAVVLIMQRIGVRNPFLYLLPGIALWAGALQAGIHPTIAGVMLGLMTPVRSWLGSDGFVAETEDTLKRVREGGEDPTKLIEHLGRINVATREAVPPVTRIEAALHPWVAFLIMPLFALANAGVSLDGLNLASQEAMLVSSGVALGLVVGKPLGVLAFSWLAVRTGLASLPRGVSWAGVSVVGFVAGIGFTMALFIGSLAFQSPAALDVSKLAVLIASAVAGVVGLLIGMRYLPRQSEVRIAQTPHEAERSTVL